MKKYKLILTAAAMTLMVVFAGCKKDNNSSGPTFTVTFNSNSGTAVRSQTVAEGKQATEPTAPAKAGYTFAGWFTDNGTFADRWDFATRAVTVDMTLYAKWTAVISIGGVRWAECNVDAPGTFAANPEDPGMFYQWNRKTAWPATGYDVAGWDDTTPSGTAWDAANDPCPSSWRVPTSAEQITLLNTAKVTNIWTTLNGVNGRRFTDKTTGASIFLPAAGRSDGGGTLSYAGSDGYYWSSSQRSSNDAWSLIFYSTFAFQVNDLRTSGFSVRCVRQ